MSREVRRVPLDWKHPTEFNPHWEIQAYGSHRRGEPYSKLHSSKERFIPLLEQSFSHALADWEAGKKRWDAGERSDYTAGYTFEEWEGPRPEPERYMPDFPEGTATGWCLYESVSEGTPCTPVFATAEELIEHLVTVGQDHDQVPMRRASAEAIVSQGFTLGSMIFAGGEMLRSDVDADKIAKL